MLLIGTCDGERKVPNGCNEGGSIVRSYEQTFPNDCTHGVSEKYLKAPVASEGN